MTQEEYYQEEERKRKEKFDEVEQGGWIFIGFLIGIGCLILLFFVIKSIFKF